MCVCVCVCGYDTMKSRSYSRACKGRDVDNWAVWALKKTEGFRRAAARDILGGIFGNWRCCSCDNSLSIRCLALGRVYEKFR